MNMKQLQKEWNNKGLKGLEKNTIILYTFHIQAFGYRLEVSLDFEWFKKLFKKS